jgi:predicted transcriptional regulator of viral defense system
MVDVTRSLSRIQGMGDVNDPGPDHVCIFEVASAQGGYFTAAQARSCGFGWDLLTHHARSGRFIRVRRGLYRLRDYPSWPREEVMAAWLAAGPDGTVVSHESALDLLGLSDVIPNAIHLTVPRSRRHLPKLPGVTFHTTSRTLRPEDITVRDGLRLTAATRTIVDAAEAGTAPEQIEMAVIQAIERGLATAPQLLRDADTRGHRVARLVAGAISRAV